MCKPHDTACIVDICFVALQTMKSNWKRDCQDQLSRFAGTATILPSVLPGGKPSLLSTRHPVSAKHIHRSATRRSQVRKFGAYATTATTVPVRRWWRWRSSEPASPPPMTTRARRTATPRQPSATRERRRSSRAGQGDTLNRRQVHRDPFAGGAVDQGSAIQARHQDGAGQPELQRDRRDRQGPRELGQAAPRAGRPSRPAAQRRPAALADSWPIAPGADAH